VLVISLMLIRRQIHSFLAASSSIHGDILVVEGWVPCSTLEQWSAFGC
jgi:hypothetical protein